MQPQLLGLEFLCVFDMESLPFLSHFLFLIPPDFPCDGSSPLTLMSALSDHLPAVAELRFRVQQFLPLVRPGRFEPPPARNQEPLYHTLSYGRIGSTQIREHTARLPLQRHSDVTDNSDRVVRAPKGFEPPTSGLGIPALCQPELRSHTHVLQER